MVAITYDDNGFNCNSEKGLKKVFMFEHIQMRHLWMLRPLRDREETKSEDRILEKIHRLRKEQDNFEKCLVRQKNQ